MNYQVLFTNQKYYDKIILRKHSICTDYRDSDGILSLWRNTNKEVAYYGNDKRTKKIYHG